MKKLSAVLALIVVSSVAFGAFADTTSPCKAGPGVACVPTIEIHGRVPRPQVVSDVSKATLKVPSAELRQPFVDRVEAATHSEPF